MITKIGFVGLGLMGLPMAKHILKTNLSLHVWNRTIEKMQLLAKAGAISTNSPKELAKKTDIILMCVTDENAVETIIFGKNGILAAKKSKQIIVDHSTISPVAAKTIAEKLRKLNITYIDAPVTGSVFGATNGTLSIFAGGDLQILEKIKPILAVYSKYISHMGTSGAGQVTKLCNQIMLLNTIFATFETLNFAKQQGLELEKLLTVLEDSLIDSRAWRIFSQATVSNTAQRLAPIDNVMKDLGYICSAAKATNTPVFLTELSAKLTNILVKKNMGQKDIVELMQLYKNPQ